KAELAATAFGRDVADAVRARIDGDYKTAAAGFRKALQNAPERKDIQLGLKLAEAGLACKAENHEDERRILEQAEPLAATQAEVNDVATAIRDCEGHLARGARDRAAAAIRARQWDEASAALDRVLALRKDDAE